MDVIKAEIRAVDSQFDNNFVIVMIIIIIIAGDYMETTATFILNLLSFLGQNM